MTATRNGGPNQKALERDTFEDRGSTQVLVLGTEGRIVRYRSVYERFLKRLGDVVGASIALVLLSPLLVGTWFALRSKLGSGVLLSQTRVGQNGKPFEMLKFRTMLPDRRTAERNFAGGDRRQTHKSDDDPRHTRIGRFLRSTSVDELPQLINVLRGDMSLVGPRPELLSVAARTEILDHPRHIVRPGLTGLFQVSGLRSTGELTEGLHLDMAYVMNLSFRSDVRIVWRTVGTLLRRTGA